MKIYSIKVHDYYDACISQFGYSNEGNSFLREPSEIVIIPKADKRSRWSQHRGVHPNDEINFLVDYFTFGSFEYYNSENKKWTIFAFKILFAGKLYGGVKIRPDIMDHQEQEVICYNWDTMSAVIKKKGFALSPERYSWFLQRKTSDEDRLKSHFKVIDITDQCIEHKLVIAFISGGSRFDTHAVELNGELKKHQFYKVLDPFTAYQELALYVDGQLSYPGNITIEIEDKYRIAAHGFDKHSFRKLPTKKRG
jgi:hypothetical protein